MKKLALITVFILLACVAWGQDVVREEIFYRQDIGDNLFFEIIENQLKDAKLRYRYLYYMISAPYEGDHPSNQWASSFMILYYNDNSIVMTLIQTQSIETIGFANTSRSTASGRNWIDTHNWRGQKEYTEINSLIRAEQMIARAKIPANIRNEYVFYIGQLAREEI